MTRWGLRWGERWGEPTFGPVALDAYFLPPTEIIHHSRDRYGPDFPNRSIRFANLYWLRRGQDINGLGGITVSGVNYGGGRWNGPLSQAEIANIQAAGYGSRIYYSGPDLTGLPAGID